MKINEELDYFPVKIGIFPLDSMLNFNLYVMRTGGQLVLYREKNLPFSVEAKEKLISYNIEYLYVMQTDRDNLKQFLESNLSVIANDETTTPAYKAKIIYEAASNMMMEVFQQPDIGENLARTANIAKSTVDFLIQGREPFFAMLSKGTKDYYTYNHSVHVCTYAVVLAKRIGYSMTSRSQLDDLATGMLLHDMGKSRIPKEILEKSGPLTEQEFTEMKKHPQYGFEMARNISAIKPMSYIPIIQHHEKLDGTGYPNGIPGSEIHIFGKIAAVVDVFDAMTTKRSHAPPKTYFEALKVMMEMSDKHLDRQLVVEFIKLLTGR